MKKMKGGYSDWCLCSSSILFFLSVAAFSFLFPPYSASFETFFLSLPRFVFLNQTKIVKEESDCEWRKFSDQ